MITTPDETAETCVADLLKGLSAGRLCLLGVGNRDRRDDGVGSLIAERLTERVGVQAINAGAVPENYLEKVARSCPDTVLIIDAVDFGGHPGEIRLLNSESIGPAGISGHALSLGMTAEYLAARTQARVALIAIQPADVGSGSALSDAVSRAAEIVVTAVSAALGPRAGAGHSRRDRRLPWPGGR
jgi:hydrogenase maturation protease